MVPKIHIIFHQHRLYPYIIAFSGNYSQKQVFFDTATDCSESTDALELGKREVKVQKSREKFVVLKV